MGAPDPQLVDALRALVVAPDGRWLHPRAVVEDALPLCLLALGADPARLSPPTAAMMRAFLARAGLDGPDVDVDGALARYLAGRPLPGALASKLAAVLAAAPTAPDTRARAAAAAVRASAPRSPAANPSPRPAR